MQKHRLSLEPAWGSLRAVLCTENKRQSEAGGESAPANSELILNCLENHHAASSSAFAGRRKQLLFSSSSGLASPPAVRPIRQNSSGC